MTEDAPEARRASALQGSFRNRWALGILAVIVVAGLGFVVGVLVSLTPIPASLESASPVETVQASTEPFLDPRQVELLISQRPNTGITVVSGGVVTAISCTPGEPIVSASTVVALNGQDLVGFQTPFPLWRDLSMGDDGIDVQAVQAELLRLGYDIPVDGELGYHTMSAYNLMIDSATGTDGWRSSIAPSDLVWLSPATSTPASCPVQVGDQVAAGGQIVPLPPVLSSVRLKVLPDDLVSGDRVLVVDGVSVPITSDGSAADLAQAQAITTTASFSRYVADPNSTVLSAQLQLTEAIQATRIPPSAVFGVDPAASRGCVSTRGHVVVGTLLGSQLGYTLMSFDEGDDVSEVDARPAKGLRCP